MIQEISQLTAFVVLHGGPLYAGYWLTRRGLGTGPRAVIAAGTLIFWASWLVLWFRVFATFSLLSLPAMLTPSILLALATAIWLRPSQANSTQLAPLGHEMRKLLTARPIVTVLLFPIAAALLVKLARALSLPPLSWDSLTYHLVNATQYIQTGHLEAFFGPYHMDVYSHLTENGDILSACFLLPFHSDTFANVMNFPFLGLLVVATYALGREFGVTRSLSALFALMVGTTPMNFAYVTTSYVDLQVTAESICAVLFLFRTTRGKRPADLLLMCASLGLAIGTKPTAIPLAGMAGGAVLVLAIHEYSRGRSARPLVILVGMVIGVLLGTEKYILNFLETGSPIYPIGVDFFGYKTPSSAYVTRIIDEIRESKPHLFVDSIGRDFKSFMQLISYKMPRHGDFRAAGPIFGLLAYGCVLSLAWRLGQLAIDPKHASARRNLGLLVLMLVPLYLYYADSTDNMKLIRRFWVGGNSRMLATQFTLMGICVLSLIPKRGPITRIAKGLLLLTALYSITFANLTLHFPISSLLLTGGGILMAACLYHWIRKAARERRMGRLASLSMAALVLLGLWTGRLQDFRDQTRRFHYKNAEDLHPFPSGGRVEAWSFLDNPEVPQTIAFTSGPEGHMFIYPLMGRNLQNRVVYASINRRGTYSTSLDQGLLRKNGNPAIWLRNLEDEAVDVVLIEKPWPMELKWIRRNPDRFTLLKKGKQYSIYRFAKHATDGGSKAK